MRTASAAERAHPNSLLQLSTRATAFSDADLAPVFGYQWLTDRCVVFQRKGAYYARDVTTNRETVVQGFPPQDRAHWFGGNLSAELSPDGRWLMWDGKRGNQEYDDGTLRVASIDGRVHVDWPRDRFPDIPGEEVGWLADSEHWISTAVWQTAGGLDVSGIAVGSVRSSSQVERLPFDGSADFDWHMIGCARDRVYVVPTPTQRKPPAAPGQIITELLLRKPVTVGRADYLRFPERAFGWSEGGLSRTGLFAWHLDIKGDADHGELNRIAMLAVWRPGDAAMREIGRVTSTEADYVDEPSPIRWLPDGRRLSFIHHRELYVVSVD